MDGQGAGVSGKKFCWADNMWLQWYGLTIGNVLAYFERSYFYDSSSLNEQAKQHVGANLEKMIEFQDGIYYRLSLAQSPRYRDGVAFTGEDLKNPEYQSWFIQDGIAVIDKVEKDGPNERVLTKYYVINGTIFEAPDLYSLMAARTRSVMFHVREALREIENIFEWNLETGYKKKIAEEESEKVVVFKQRDLDDLVTERGHEFSLQNKLLESLLKEIGIDSTTQ